MWAPDCAYKNGTYYFYFPHPSGTDWNDSWKIGVATSRKPAEGFKVKGYIKGMDALIDPCVFVDDDGQAYIYNGGGGLCKGGKLKDNMMELDGPMQVMEGLEDFHEATWIHKYNGKNIFTVKEKHGNVVYLEINQDNKYDFILDEIKKAFPDQYKIFSMHDISGHNQIYFTIKNVCISFDYSLQDGQNWMYRIANEL